MLKRKRKQLGVTALEMLLVIAFVSIAFLSVLQILSSTLVSSEELEGSIIAQNLANQKMEELLSTNFASLTSEARSAFAAYPNYEFTVDVTSLDAHLKGLEVIIYFDVSGAELSYQVDTMITDW